MYMSISCLVSLSNSALATRPMRSEPCEPCAFNFEAGSDKYRQTKCYKKGRSGRPAILPAPLDHNLHKYSG